MSDPDWRDVISRLQNHGWRISALAEKAGCSRQIIYQLIKGRVKKSTALWPLLSVLEKEDAKLVPVGNEHLIARIQELEHEVGIWRQAALALTNLTQPEVGPSTGDKRRQHEAVPKLRGDVSPKVS